MLNANDLKEKRWERQQKRRKEGLDNALVGNPSSRTVSYHRNVLTGGNLDDYDDLTLSPSGRMDNDYSSYQHDYNDGNNYRNLTSNQLGDVIEGIDTDVSGLGQGKKRERRKGKGKDNGNNNNNNSNNNNSNNGKKNNNNGDKETTSNYKFIPWDSLFNENVGRKTNTPSSLPKGSPSRTNYEYCNKKNYVNKGENNGHKNQNHNHKHSPEKSERSERSDVSDSSSPWVEDDDVSGLPEDDEEGSDDSRTIPDENISLKKRKNEKNFDNGKKIYNHGKKGVTSTESDERDRRHEPYPPHYPDPDPDPDQEEESQEHFIHNPEPDDDNDLDIEEFSEEPNLCFFCHFYSKSEGLKSSNMNIGIMLKLIEDMLFKGNISIEAVGIEAEYYYDKNIYQPALLQGKYNTPKIVASDIVDHYRKHMNICPSIHYSNTFQILFNAREVLKDRLFLHNSETGEIIPSKQNYELMLKTIQVMNAIHNADLTKSPYYAGDGLHWSMKTKGAFLNDGTNITEEHKKMMNDWKEEPYKPMFIEDID